MPTFNETGSGGTVVGFIKQGIELISNGAFDSTADWDTTGDWAITGGAASVNLGESGHLNQNAGLAVGNYAFILSYDVVVIPSSNMIARVDETTVANSDIGGLRVVRSIGTGLLDFEASGGSGSVTLDNVSMLLGVPTDNWVVTLGLGGSIIGGTAEESFEDRSEDGSGGVALKGTAVVELVKNSFGKCDDKRKLNCKDKKNQKNVCASLVRVNSHSRSGAYVPASVACRKELYKDGRAIGKDGRFFNKGIDDKKHIPKAFPTTTAGESFERQKLNTQGLKKGSDYQTYSPPKSNPTFTKKFERQPNIT